MENVSSEISAIKANTDELRRLQQETMEETRPNLDRRRRMDDLAEENKRLARSARASLAAERRWCEKRAKEGPPANSQASVGEWQIRSTQVRAQANRLAEAWTGYNNLQADFYEKSRSQLVKRCRVAGISLTEEEIADKVSSGSGTVFARAILEQEHLERRKVAELEGRHRDFLRLENSLAEVHAMFLEVAALVEDQGTIVDTIEVNIGEAEDYTRRGVEEVKQAQRMKKKIRKRKVYIALAVGATVVGVVLIVALLA